MRTDERGDVSKKVLNVLIRCLSKCDAWFSFSFSSIVLSSHCDVIKCRSDTGMELYISIMSSFLAATALFIRTFSVGSNKALAFVSCFLLSHSVGGTFISLL